MIEPTNIVPENMQYLMVKQHLFYALTIAGEQYGTAAIRPMGLECQVHFRFCRFSHKTYRQALKDWSLVKTVVKSFGCKYAVVGFENYQDEKFLKFLNRFGFGEPKLLAVVSQEV